MRPFWDGSPHLLGKCRLVTKLVEPERASPHLGPKVQQMQCLCCTGTVRQHRHCDSWGSSKLVSRVCAEVQDLGLKKSMSFFWVLCFFTGRRGAPPPILGRRRAPPPILERRGAPPPFLGRRGAPPPISPPICAERRRRMLLFNPKSCTSAQTLDTSLPEPQLTQCLC